MEESLKGLEEEANGVGKRLWEAQVLQHMLGMAKMKKYEGSLATTRAISLLNILVNGGEGDGLEA